MRHRLGPTLGADLTTLGKTLGRQAGDAIGTAGHMGRSRGGRSSQRPQRLGVAFSQQAGRHPGYPFTPLTGIEVITVCPTVEVIHCGQIQEPVKEHGHQHFRIGDIGVPEHHQTHILFRQETQSSTHPSEPTRMEDHLVVAVVLEYSPPHAIHGVLDTGLPPFGGDPLLGGADHRFGQLLHNSRGDDIRPVSHHSRQILAHITDRGIHTGCG